MKQLLFTFYLFIIINVPAQVILQGKITDFNTGEPLAFANILTDNNEGVISDFDGRFELSVPAYPATLKVSYMGYEPQSVQVEKGRRFYEIRLKPAAESLDAVVIDGKYVNPAIRLMQRAIELKRFNDYRYLKEANFKKYIKFVVGAETDKIQKEFDTVYINNRIVKIDSSLYEFKKDLADKHLWMFETLAEVYVVNGKEKNKVLATRTAGLKKPFYEFIAMQFSEQNVYDDTYKLLFKEYLGPFSKKSFKTYRYKIADTVRLQGRPVIVIDYKNTQKPLISGKIYLDARLLSIAKLTLNTYKNFQFNAVYDFKFITTDKKYRIWFPDKVHIKIKKAEQKDGLTVADIVSITEKPQDSLSITEKGDTIVHTNRHSTLDYTYADYRSNFFDFKSFIPNKPPRYDLEIAPDATRKDESFWQQITGTETTDKERNTYKYIDSVAQKEKLEFYLHKYKRIADGYFPVLPYFDLDLIGLLDYNRYEGFRLKIGGKTNENLSNKWYVSGYGAYGFKDKELKYAASFHYKLHHPTQTFLQFTYQKDLQKSAGFSPWQKRNIWAMPQHLADDKFFMQKGFELSLSHLLTATLKLDVSYTQADHTTKFRIPYHSGRIEFLEKDLRFAKLQALYTPYTKYYLSPEGRKVLQEGYPKFYLSFEKNFPSLQIDPTDYYRVEIQAWLKKTWLNKNITEIFIQTGYASYQAAIDKLFMPNTNDYTGSNPLKRFNLTKKFSFETMKDLEFVDNYVFATYLHHSFQYVKLSAKRSVDIELQGKIAYGLSFSSNTYVGIKSLKKVYYETGVKFDRLLGSMGLGFYYRLGSYAHDRIWDNLSIRLTLAPFKFLNSK